TSVACLVVAISLLLASRVPVVARKSSRIVTVLIVAVPVLLVLQEAVDVKALVLSLLGRDPSLTNRTDVWAVLDGMEVNSWVGAGFMNFWTGARLEDIWKTLGAGINQAHNGYLEQYLNLGYIGLAFIAAIVLSGLVKVRRHL